MKIVVDSNIVFSAILNSNSSIGKILLNAKALLQFYSCQYLRSEIHRHRAKLLRFTKLSANELTELEAIVMANITFIDERLLPKELLDATETLLQTIDVNDTPFVAMAIHLGAKLWTGDLQLYNGLKSKGYNDILLTTELSLLLDEIARA